MVQLVIQNANSEECEVVLIELQGSLESTAEEVSGMRIGDIHLDAKVKK